MTSTRATQRPASARPAEAAESHRFGIPAIPPNFFGISFGLAGIAEVWKSAGPLLGTSDAVGRIMYLVASAVWFGLLLTYVSKGLAAMLRDWHNPLLSPFIALAAIVPTLLSGELCDVNMSLGRVFVAVTSFVTIAIGAWLTAEWIVNEVPDEAVHPGYLLPTATGV